MLRAAASGLLLLAGHCSGLRTRDGPVELCSIHKADDNAADPVGVFLLPNNGRTFSFGDHASTTESTVHCLGDANCDSPVGAVSNAADCPACPCQVADDALLSASISVMFQEISPVCSHAKGDAPVDVLLIGLGGGTLHRHVRRTCPEGTRVRSVEVDPRVAGVAEKYFGLETAPGTSEIDVDDAFNAVSSLASASDARLGLSQGASHLGVFSDIDDDDHAAPASMGSGGWDIVATDCFIGHGETPETCRSPEFVKAVRKIVKPGGIALQHIWHASPDRDAVAGQFQSTMENYRGQFGNSSVSVISIPRDPSIMWDDVIKAHGYGPGSADASTV